MSTTNPLSFTHHIATLCLAGLACIGLAGCSSDDTAHDHATHALTLTGSAFAAAVNGAHCMVKDPANGAILEGPVTTDAAGDYRITVHEAYLQGELLLECSGGSYVDEATGSSVADAGILSAHIAADSLDEDDQVHATPASTLLATLINRFGHSLAEAQALFTSAFGFSPDHAIAPADATHEAPDATDAQRLAGLRAAAFSQLGNDLGLDPARQFDMLSALAEDLADGQLDGAGSAGGITLAGTATALGADIQNRFGRALLNFRAGGRDLSGLTNDKIGVLPFARTALTDRYRLRYLPDNLPGSMAAMQGKSRFQIAVTDAATGLAPQTGLSLSLLPVMHMASHSHGTPVDGCTETATAGTYACTVYYLMASQMMNGTAMGYWDLRLLIDGTDETHFYPPVMMAMGDSTRATLKGVDDRIAGMGQPESRSYYLFRSGLSGETGNHRFQLFIAARENMMDYPALASGSILNPGDAEHELSVTSISVEVSTDAGSWITASEDGGGYWTAEGLGGLDNGSQGEIHVRLSVNGEQKSTDGNPATDGTAYATFLATPAPNL
ncbi:MAG: hypothetical protein RRB22_03145 [Gammaproteobacteria bacterium]|nr:hypothetical protein [Gammaproteobacteria bacterium]